jgi:hypothetical protein
VANSTVHNPLQGMDQIRVIGVERDSVRPHPTADGSVLVTVRLSSVPSRFWRARFSHALLKSSLFGRFELGPDGSSVDIAVERDGSIAEHLEELTSAVEQTNSDVVEEQRRAAEAEEIREDAQAADVERVRAAIDRIGN